MISREDLKHISVGINDYGGGWYDGELYYKGKLIATYPCSGHVDIIINEENYQKLELDEKVDQELKEMFPITMLTESQIDKAREIAKSNHTLDAVKYIHTIIPDEGMKGAKAYYDLYIDERRQD